jgi:hypothetical protein
MRHASLFPPFTGLVDFLFSINNILTPTMFIVILFFCAIYLSLPFPDVQPNCPYHTPFSLGVLKAPRYLPPRQYSSR